MHTDHPFTTPASPDKAELLAYLEGRLSPERAHAVERSMEEDPFLRDAMEGLSAPGATSALAGLEHQRPSAKGILGKRTWFLIGAVVGVGIMAVTWSALPMLEKPDAPAFTSTEQQPTVTASPAPYPWTRFDLQFLRRHRPVPNPAAPHEAAVCSCSRTT